MAEHGGNIDEAARAYGKALGDMVDLSTGISPRAYEIELGNSALFQALPLASDLHRLYDRARHCYQLHESAHICAGAGSQQLLAHLPRLFKHHHHVWCPGPTYNEHSYRWQGQGHLITDHSDWDHQASVIILGQPNNPTGRLWTDDEIKRANAQTRAKGGLLVIDEAFIDGFDASASCVTNKLAADDHVVILRSVGKFYGLAGLRVGFAISGQALIEKLADDIGPWPVSQPAINVASAALADRHWQADHKLWLAQKARWLAERLADKGFAITAQLPLFITITDARVPSFHRHLAKAGFWTRCYQADPTMMRLGLMAEKNEAAFGKALDQFEEAKTV